MINCASISGGRTSAMMLRMMLDEGISFIPMFCNTGKERNETLDFVHNIENAWGVPIVWLEYTRVPASQEIASLYPNPRSRKTVTEQMHRGESTHWFKIVDYRTARRRNDSNTPFEELLGWANVLPNVRTRMCSVQMKVRTMMRYLFSQGIQQWTDHIGIRYDERDRTLDILANCPSYRQCKFPLVESFITESQVLDFWRNQPFDLQLQSHQGNCDLCFLKARWKRIRIAKDDPSALSWWIKQEKTFAAKPHITGDGKYFRIGQPYALIETLARQGDLFSEPDDDVPCGCGDKGFALADDFNCEL